VPKILLLTAQTLPHDDHETALVAQELTRLGIDSEIVPWSAPGVAEREADLVVIRTTWDYTTRLHEFQAVLGALSAQVTNPIDVVKWNCHKGYLTELAGSGVPIVPTQLYFAADLTPAHLLELPDFDVAEIVVKPAVSAGAVGVGRYPSGSPAASAQLMSLLATGDVLVQPFQSEVLQGERSMIFLGGMFSHAVRKTPSSGDFRVQEQFGGVIHPHLPSDAELAVAQAALALVPAGSAGLTYARVDVVGTQNLPLVMELELIEPELFLPLAPGSPLTFAKALAARL